MLFYIAIRNHAPARQGKFESRNEKKRQKAHLFAYKLKCSKKNLYIVPDFG